MTTKVTKGLLADDSVGTDQIEAGAVDTSELADDAVTTAKIADDQVTQPKIGPGAVGSTELADDAVTANKYADASIPLAAIPDATITGAKLVNLTVTSTKIATQAITTSKLGLQSVDTTNYKAGSINSTALGDASVVTDKLDDNAVTLAKLQQGTEGSFITFDNSSDATLLAPGAEGEVLSIQNGVPAWGGSTIPVGTIIDYFGQSAPIGWLIADGRTIGSAASGADFSSATAENLYYHLWNNFTNSIIAVAGGRGASANADWSADKVMTLPDFTGRVCVMADLDTANPGTTITSSTFSSGISTVGATGGTEKVTLTEANIPDHRHHMFRAATATNPLWDSQPATIPTSTVNQQVTKWNGSLTDEERHQHSYRMYYNNSFINPTAGMTSSPVDTSGAAISTGTAVNKMQPSILVVKLLKL
jgi:microcystin-dependent protein